MHFVDDIHPKLTAKRCKFDVLADFAHIVHPGVRRPIDLNDVDGRSLRNFMAVFTAVTRMTRWASLAIEGLRENAGDGRFSNSPSAGK